MKVSKSLTYRRGLNLIELVVVVMILGVIFSGIFATYYTAMQISKNSAPKKGTSRKDIIFSIENIRNTFTQAYYFSGNKRLIFKGKGDGEAKERRDKVIFAAHHTSAEDLGLPAIREVAFYLKPMSNNDKYYYLIRREDEMVDAYPLKGGTEHVLLDYVKSFQLKYASQGEKWVDAWDSALTNKLPRLIRIEIIALVGKTEVKYESLAFPGLYFK